MTTFERFKDGITTAADSFRVTWRNKILILYPLLPTTLAIALQLLFKPVSTAAQPFIIVPSLDAAFGNILRFSALSTLQAFVLSLAIGLLTTFIMTFFNAAVIYHTTRLVRIKQAEVLKTLHACLSKWWPLLQWVIVLLIVETILNMPALIMQLSTTSTYLINITLLIMNLMWALATFLVLPFLVLNEISLWNALRLSAAVVRDYIWEFMGGWCLIALVALGLQLVLFIPHVFSETNGTFNLIFAPIDIIIGSFMAAVALVFKALFYDNYYEKPLEELALAQADLEF